jgi:hypothetical protein
MSRFLFLTTFIIFLVTACAPAQSLSPDLARQRLLKAWQADQHIVWELDWPNAPIGGPLTVETWRAGTRYRFEILEAASPALIGEALVFDGQHAWRYNRFNPPLTFNPVSPSLSPVSDAFIIIDQLLNTSPEMAVQETAQVNFKPAQKIVVTFINGDTLALWQDTETGLPVQVIISAKGQQVALKARHSEPLPNPPDGLFSVGAWVY